MKKADFINLVQKKGGFETKKEAVKAISAFTEAVTAALSKKEDVALIGFGTFSSAIQKGRSGTVPGTDKTYTTEDKYIPKFKAGKSLREVVAKA